MPITARESAEIRGRLKWTRKTDAFTSLEWHLPLAIKQSSKVVKVRFFLRNSFWEFPGGPVARILCSQCRGPWFDPSQGTR